ATVFALSIVWPISAQTPKRVQPSAIPKAWDDVALAGWHIPLAVAGSEPVQLTADQFYQLPELKIYRSYPVYAPGTEPPGYMEKLGKVDPELVFDPVRLTTDADWVRAGEFVFDAPVTISAVGAQSYINDRAWFEAHQVP